jgi:hypothetical protein
VPRCANGDIAPGNASSRWSEAYMEGMRQAGRSTRLDPARVCRQLEQAGFVDVQQVVTPCHLSPWSHKEHENIASKWLNLAFTDGLEARSLLPLIDYGPLKDRQEVAALCRQVKDEVCCLSYRFFMEMLVTAMPLPKTHDINRELSRYVWSGRRPI